ncbi:hypothetical protein QBC43DRAFT_48722 [Cladorrhinum sp. PSN259]|nr:hypothetical protein QBC43DRAFT_48722 [Cladorrhinum sp. PSN259]
MVRTLFIIISAHRVLRKQLHRGVPLTVSRHRQATLKFMLARGQSFMHETRYHHTRACYSSAHQLEHTPPFTLSGPVETWLGLADVQVSLANPDAIFLFFFSSRKTHTLLVFSCLTHPGQARHTTPGDTPFNLPHWLLIDLLLFFRHTQRKFFLWANAISFHTEESCPSLRGKGEIASPLLLFSRISSRLRCLALFPVFYPSCLPYGQR